MRNKIATPHSPSSEEPGTSSLHSLHVLLLQFCPYRFYESSYPFTPLSPIAFVQLNSKDLVSSVFLSLCLGSTVGLALENSKGLLTKPLFFFCDLYFFKPQEKNSSSNFEGKIFTLIMYISGWPGRLEQKLWRQRECSKVIKNMLDL